MKHCWLRDEVKPFEQRSALTPQAAEALVKSGCKVTVEKSKVRIFPDELFEKVGCEMVEHGTWPKAPKEAFILGLKELPDPDEKIPKELTHNHIFFAHCYKNQGGWKDVLNRFVKGGSELYDLEFLNDDSGRRIAAFGHSAGFAGMAVGIMVWCHQQIHGFEKQFPKLTPFPSKKELIDFIQSQIKQIERKPKILVIGALGRCGKGSVEVCKMAGLDVIEWDMEETKKGGPFKELLEVDILINDIYLMGKIPSFLTLDMLKEKRNLTVFVDVSCDTTNPNNPYPIYNQTTTFDKPTLRVEGNLDVVAIDHLPTLIPKESSEDFVGQLTPHLVNLTKIEDLKTTNPTKEEKVWTRARDLFYQKVKLMNE